MDEKEQLQNYFCTAQNNLFLDFFVKAEFAGFLTDKSLVDSKLFWSPEKNLREIRYEVKILLDKKGASIILFFLDSKVLHVSSIFSILGVPPAGQPILSCNLNLKPKFPSLGVISGFRTHNSEHANLLPSLNTFKYAPLYSYTKKDFYGIRHVYHASQLTVDFAMQHATTLFENWMSIRDNSCEPHLEDNCDNLLADVFCFHDKGGGVFDKVFGLGWVKSLFDYAWK